MTDIQIVFIVLAVISWIVYVARFKETMAMWAMGFPATLTFMAVQYPNITKYLENNSDSSNLYSGLIIGVILFQAFLYVGMVMAPKEVKSENTKQEEPKKAPEQRQTKSLYKFTVSSSEGTHVVKANHPDEVWGEIWSEGYPPSDAKIVDVVDNDDEE